MITLPRPPRASAPQTEWEQWNLMLWRAFKEIYRAGFITTHGGSDTPDGFLLCDGTAYAEADYPDLYSAIGNAWDTFNGAAAPGAGSFRVPDFRGRAPIGAGTGSGLTARALGDSVGEETHTLSSNEMPSHKHNVNVMGFTATGISAPSGGTGLGAVAFGNNTGGNLNVTNTPGNAATANDAAGHIVNTGGGGSHNNMQPSAVANFIIKT
jgi:microcystin-dependent protein